MTKKTGSFFLLIGGILGIAVGWVLFGQPATLRADNDRYGDYILSTGPITVGFDIQQFTKENDGGLIQNAKNALPGASNNTQTETQVRMVQFDGVWLLDYRAGKLLGTAVDQEGKISSWSEVDLVNEFSIAPKQDVHFVMTTGMVGQRAALYIAETTTGKFGVYTMWPGPQGSLQIRRHDLVMFRANDQGSPN